MMLSLHLINDLKTPQQKESIQELEKFPLKWILKPTKPIDIPQARTYGVKESFNFYIFLIESLIIFFFKLNLYKYILLMKLKIIS